MKTTHEQVRKFLDNEGVGTGTNITLHMCACLIYDFSNSERKNNEEYLNMQYYHEYCESNGYVTPQDWIEKYKHF